MLSHERALASKSKSSISSGCSAAAIALSLVAVLANCRRGRRHREFPERRPLTGWEHLATLRSRGGEDTWKRPIARTTLAA